MEECNIVKKLTVLVLSLMFILPLSQPVMAATSSEIVKQIQQTQEQINSTNAKLEEINASITELQSQIAVNNALMPQKQAEYDAVMQKVSDRARAMYITGSDDYLSYLFSAKDISQFLSNAQDVSAIVSSDTKLWEEAQAAKNNLENANNVVQNSTQQLAEQKTQAETLKQQQTQQLADQQTQLAKATDAEKAAGLAAASSSSGSSSSSSAMAASGDISNIAASSSPKVEKAVQIMIELCNDPTYGYSQSNRWGPNFDCSSSVLYSLRQAGFDTGGANASYSYSALTSCGWTQIGVSGLERGDILVNSACHVAMYVGGGQVAEFVSDYDGASGDSTGQESYVHAYYDFPWDYALRYTGE